MAMNRASEYQQAVSEYTAQLRGLFVPPRTAGRTRSTRGAETLSPEVLARRAQKLADTSRRVGELTAGYLESDDAQQREAAELKLLAQANAEIQVARALLETTVEEGRARSRSRTTRASRAAGIQRSLDQLADVLEKPPESGVQPFLRTRTRRAATRPTDPEAAKVRLQENVESALKSITREAGDVGGRAARDLLLMDAAALLQGISLISKDAAQLLDKAVAGLSAVLRRLGESGLRLLLQAYEWVLRLIGRDAEQQARKQVASWLDELKQDKKEFGEGEGLFDKLVKRMYSPDAIASEVTKWIAQSNAELDKVNDAADKVESLGNKYHAKMEQAEKILNVMALAKGPLASMPQARVIAAAITLTVLGYVVYAGYDHVDSGRVSFNERFRINIPDRVEGVRETVQKSLGIPESVKSET